MAYEKTEWINGETPINAANLNKMEEGIEAANKMREIEDGGTGGSTAKEARENLGLGKILYEGNWEVGDIIVPEIGDYRFFLIILDGKGTAIPAVKQGKYLRGAGSYPYSDDIMTSYEFAATISGETCTLVRCVSRDHKSSGHTNNGTCKVSSIIGLV